jgi:hypothetical protein
MRIRHLSGVAVAAVCAVTALAPGSASAARTAARHRVTINVAPRTITAGDPVVIFGRLVGLNHSGQAVHLFHHVPGVPGFQPAGNTTTDAVGAYEFSPADTPVDTNRTWFVTSGGAFSRPVRERVRAQVTLTGPTDTNLLTGPGHPYTFTGTVSPATVGARVVLERQNAATGSDDWHSIDGRHPAVVAADGTFTITHVFVAPGDANIRVLVRADTRNIASPSSPLNYQISQTQVAGFTILSSADPITVGSPVTITGVGPAGQSLTLFARTDQQHAAAVATTTSDASGNYSFAPQSPTNSTFYQVRLSNPSAAASGPKHSAILFEGVKDALTASASPTTVMAGGVVTFYGTVNPPHPGHVIYLQRQNTHSGDFHTVQVGRVNPDGTYSIARQLFDPGVRNYRVYIPGGPENQGAGSQVIAITVTPAPASSLPAVQNNAG